MIAAQTNGQAGVADRMDSIPSDNGVKDGESGPRRFAACNGGLGVGSSFARRAGRFREAIQSALSEGDVQEIVLAVTAKAKRGDVPAARLVLAYAVGKPQPAPEPDRATVDEAKLLREQALAGVALATLVEQEHKAPEILSATYLNYDEELAERERRAAEEPDEEDEEGQGYEDDEDGGPGERECYDLVKALQDLPPERRPAVAEQLRRLMNAAPPSEPPR